MYLYCRFRMWLYLLVENQNTMGTDLSKMINQTGGISISQDTPYLITNLLEWIIDAKNQQKNHIPNYEDLKLWHLTFLKGLYQIYSILSLGQATIVKESSHQNSTVVSHHFLIWILKSYLSLPFNDIKV